MMPDFIADLKVIGVTEPDLDRSIARPTPHQMWEQAERAGPLVP